VPEKREEITTEGGLDVAGNIEQIKKITKKLSSAGIAVSHFIDPENNQIVAAKACGAEYIELHTGQYAEFSDSKRPEFSEIKAKKELSKLIEAASYAKSLGLKVNAGHGLTYENTKAIAELPELFEELNIGHNIIAEAVFSGLSAAIQKMKILITGK
jgi:pyridoxine 5-phosphate synthase